MSTRSNVVIKKGNNMCQLYHHHDSYPSGVGKNLDSYLKEIQSLSDEKKNTILSSPTEFALWLADDDRHDEYRYESCSINFHGDIEYAYIIDLAEETITCVEVRACRMSGNTWDKEIVNGTFQETENIHKVYVQMFDEDFPDDEEEDC